MSDWKTLSDQLGLKLRPIDAWPGDRPRRTVFERSPFSAALKDTLGTLKLELRELSAREVVLQIDVRETDLRQDGLPRAGCVVKHPGVVLAFAGKHGPLRLYFDRFSRWEHNLRALAMHLADLRHAGLYGVGTDGEQYRGWLALPAPATLPAQEAAARTLLELSGLSVGPDAIVNVVNDPQARAIAWRRAVLLHHPDTGGDAAKFDRAREARALLDAAQ